MTIRKGAVIDFRTILLLDLLYMLFFLLSGKPEVVVAAFLLSGTVLFLTELYVAMIRYAVLFVALFFLSPRNYKPAATFPAGNTFFLARRGGFYYPEDTSFPHAGGCDP